MITYREVTVRVTIMDATYPERKIPLHNTQQTVKGGELIALARAVHQLAGVIPLGCVVYDVDIIDAGRLLLFSVTGDTPYHPGRS